MRLTRSSNLIIHLDEGQDDPFPLPPTDLTWLKFTVVVFCDNGLQFLQCQILGLQNSGFIVTFWIYSPIVANKAFGWDPWLPKNLAILVVTIAGKEDSPIIGPPFWGLILSRHVSGFKS